MAELRVRIGPNTLPFMPPVYEPCDPPLSADGQTWRRGNVRINAGYDDDTLVFPAWIGDKPYILDDDDAADDPDNQSLHVKFDLSTCRLIVQRLGAQALQELGAMRSTDALLLMESVQPVYGGDEWCPKFLIIDPEEITEWVGTAYHYCADDDGLYFLGEGFLNWEVAAERETPDSPELANTALYGTTPQRLMVVRRWLDRPYHDATWYAQTLYGYGWPEQAAADLMAAADDLPNGTARFGVTASRVRTIMDVLTGAPDPDPERWAENLMTLGYGEQSARAIVATAVAFIDADTAADELHAVAAHVVGERPAPAAPSLSAPLWGFSSRMDISYVVAAHTEQQAEDKVDALELIVRASLRDVQVLVVDNDDRDPQRCPELDKAAAAQ